jgi:hypothetical protein
MHHSAGGHTSNTSALGSFIGQSFIGDDNAPGSQTSENDGADHVNIDFAGDGSGGSSSGRYSPVARKSSK